MKTNDYLKKYNLRTPGWIMDEVSFIMDVLIEFRSSIEYLIENKSLTYETYKSRSIEIKNKLNSINNKTAGNIDSVSERIMDYVMNEVLFQYFPALSTEIDRILSLSESEIVEELGGLIPKSFGRYGVDAYALRELNKLLTTNPTIYQEYRISALAERIEYFIDRKKIHDESKDRRSRKSDPFTNLFDLYCSLLGNSILQEPDEVHYKVLGITEVRSTVTAELIKAKFRGLAMIHHPDKGGKRERFEELIESRDKLLMYYK